MKAKMGCYFTSGRCCLYFCCILKQIINDIITMTLFYRCFFLDKPGKRNQSREEELKAWTQCESSCANNPDTGTHRSQVLLSFIMDIFCGLCYCSFGKGAATFCFGKFTHFMAIKAQYVFYFKALKVY